MSYRQTVAMDAMGGDHGPSVIVPAVAEILKRYTEVSVVLVGQPQVLEPLVAQHIRSGSKRLSIEPASDVVGMDEAPGLALRQKKNSSMRIALNLVKEGRAFACVSAGNTGALMATARFVLKTLPGVDRPAIIRGLPTVKNTEVRVLDLGANTDSAPHNLYQFAVMGSVVSNALDDVDSPSVALLNIGREPTKGNDLVKKTAHLLSACSDLNYIGFIEADHILDGSVHVVVCDGFVGNVLLKSMEGTMKMIKHAMRNEARRHMFNRWTGLLARPFLRRVARTLDPERHNGAVLLGLDGIVVKSHGGATTNGLVSAIEEAILEMKKNIPQLIKLKVDKLLNKNEA